MPQPLLNYDETWWCSLHLIDIEQDDIACEERNDIDKTCMSCPYSEKQSYKIITRDERFKEYI